MGLFTKDQLERAAADVPMWEVKEISKNDVSWLHRLLHGIFGKKPRKLIDTTRKPKIKSASRKINEGKQKGNTRNITSQRPKIKPAPQKSMLKNQIIAGDILKRLTEVVKDLEPTKEKSSVRHGRQNIAQGGYSNKYFLEMCDNISKHL